jgi:putative membrane protein
MKNNFSSPNAHDSTPVKDQLAIYRTTLANERTFLAYIRTSLSFFVVSASFIKFFDNVILEFIGWFLLPLGAFITIKGILSFKKMKDKIKEEEEEVHIAIS